MFKMKTFLKELQTRTVISLYETQGIMCASSLILQL